MKTSRMHNPGAWERAMASDAGLIQVVPARLRDLRAVARIQRLAFRPGLAYGPSALFFLWSAPHTTFLVARHGTGDVVIGCVIADRHQGNARIMNIATHPEHRRRGVARDLLRGVDRANPEGDVVLMAEEWNTGAQMLYTSEGFTRAGFARDYYGSGRHGIWMRKRRHAASGSGTSIYV